MMRKGFVAVGFFILALSSYYFLWRSPESTKGKQAPDFSTELITGEKFSLSDLKGEYVLLDFWGSWCGPCRRDNPSLVSLYNEFNTLSFKDAKGFKVVTIALEKNDRHWRKAAERDGFAWKHQIVQEAKIVLLSPLAQKYAVSEVPTKFLIGPNGNILGVNQQYEEIKAYLKSKI